jgi:Chaperone of endosialidase
MRTLNLSPFVLLTALAAMAGSAYGQQPPDVVNSDGQGNTAMGTDALFSLTPSPPYGSYNTASGYSALYSNTTGSDNTASGYKALYFNTTGDINTASGFQALFSNTIGRANTVFGWAPLYSNTTGSHNAAFGVNTLYSNTTGGNNTASGDFALFSNTSGSNNTASGYNALNGNYVATQIYATGSNNTGIGAYALYSYSTGNNNIAAGYQAGYNLTTGSNNIDIGNVGAAGESNTIRIGTKGTQKATVIAGIYGTPVNGAAVVVSSTGRLGVRVSSERFKTAISSMGSNSAKFGQLRPVTFHLKSEPHGALQYGLVAEEVAKVYPDLVIRDGSGRIDGVRYDELAPMLLNEVQQQQQKIAAQAAQLRDVQQQLAMLQVALTKLQPKDEIVAQR